MVVKDQVGERSFGNVQCACAVFIVLNCIAGHRFTDGAFIRVSESDDGMNEKAVGYVEDLGQHRSVHSAEPTAANAISLCAQNQIFSTGAGVGVIPGSLDLCIDKQYNIGHWPLVRFRRMVRVQVSRPFCRIKYRA